MMIMGIVMTKERTVMATCNEMLTDAEEHLDIKQSF